MFFPCISLCMFKNWQKIWPVRGFGSSLECFFLAVSWNSIALRKYLKQKTGRFSKAVSVPFFASGSEHPVFKGLGPSLYFGCCCDPQFFQTVFLQAGTQDHRDPESHVHFTDTELENVYDSGGTWLLMAWNQYFPCWELPSPSASTTDFNPWNCLLLLQICRGREKKCLLSLKCSDFNSSFKYFSQVSHITRLVFWL